MSRYQGRLLQLQMALENPATEEDRALILGELAAMREAISQATLSSEG